MSHAAEKFKLSPSFDPDFLEPEIELSRFVDAGGQTRYYDLVASSGPTTVTISISKYDALKLAEHILSNERRES